MDWMKNIINMKILVKIFKILSIIITIGIFLLILLCLLFIGYATDDKDACLDTGICKKGIKINTEYGLIKVNKENCLKYSWKWDKESQTCNMRN